ncbi:LysR family transcriptional regulator [Crossiella cryophila]|uniref:DNA-binding transcriptional LysR family regulator n=1 Tax=Crossiella cryophila TaxID=43355 RepID=A0A7W7FTE5_9PSEU|nr:LysR family transcriptional regulator [Crossiella cryophila]MBB4676925.1 DNA-binding transcriptional LysR family regulator [Crossiella cryophila]
MLDLPQLHALHAVHTQGSVRAAARTLHLTTSAVSQRLARLERELGKPMLERTGRGVRLTEAALVLVAHADRILAAVAEAEAAVEEKAGVVLGGVSVAAFSTAARALLPPALELVRARHPGLRVGLGELEPHEALPLVAGAELDLAIVQDWPDAPLELPGGLARAGLLDDVVDVVVPDDHRLGAVATLAELGGESWVSWPEGTGCRDWLRRVVGGADVVHSAGEHHTQLALVARGLGIAMMPRLGRGLLPGGVRVVELEPVSHRHVYAVWRVESARRPAIRAVLEAIDLAALELTG